MADAKSTTSTTSSGKRKRNTPPVFYGVRVGRTPGVYQNWDEAKRQVDGIQGQDCRKFSTYTEAEAFITGNYVANPAKTKYYGVAVGHVPGVYTDYTTVQAQTKGYKDAKQKSFSSRADAQAFVDEFKRHGSAPVSLRGDLSQSPSLAANKPANIGVNAPKKQKKGPAPALTNGDIKYEPGWGPLPPEAEDGFDRTIKLDPDTGSIRIKTDEELNATRMQPTGNFSGPIRVYTDGSSLGNGQVGAVGGVGVYFGPKDPRNVSEALRGSRQTNQRAELTAVARALDHIPIDRDTLIVTDSNYAIKCLTVWFSNWEKNGWKNSSGKDVENRDIIEPIVARIRERDMSRAKTKFQWIKGHSNDPGNVAADALAVQGSRYSTPELRNEREFSETLNTPTRSRFIPPKTHHIMEAKIETKKDPELILMSEQAPAADEEAEFDEIFATLAAEESASQITEAALAQDKVLPSVAAEHLAKAGAKEGQEHLEQFLHSEQLEVKANGPEEMDMMQNTTERV